MEALTAPGKFSNYVFAVLILISTLSCLGASSRVIHESPSKAFVVVTNAPEQPPLERVDLGLWEPQKISLSEMQSDPAPRQNNGAGEQNPADADKDAQTGRTGSRTNANAAGDFRTRLAGA